jgi:hypothetical protein
MSETGIQAKILLAIGRIPGLLCWRNNTGALRNKTGRLIRYGLVGSPDILACYRGRFLGIEVKTSSGDQSDDQINFQRALERAGGVYVVCRSADEAVSAIEAIQ